MTPIIEKIKKLLALSKSSNAEEAAVAASIANKLIEEHRLSIADLGADESFDPLIESDNYLYETGRITPWKQSLAIRLSKFYGCAIYNKQDFSLGRAKARFCLVGKKSDVEIVNYMFAYLTMEIQRLSDIHAKGMGHGYCLSYCTGAVTGIMDKLNESKQEARHGGNTAAIVKLDARLAEATEFLGSKFQYVTKSGKIKSKLKRELVQRLNMILKHFLMAGSVVNRSMLGNLLESVKTQSYWGHNGY